MKEPVRLIPTTNVLRRKTGLQQNTGRQVATLPHLTVGGELSVTGECAQVGPQVIHRNVHGSGNVAGSKFQRRANVQQERLLGSRSRQYFLDIDLGMISPQ